MTHKKRSVRVGTPLQGRISGTQFLGTADFFDLSGDFLMVEENSKKTEKIQNTTLYTCDWNEAIL
ncbi:hypothetical protein SAMN04487771_10475 [[Clostridium] aminophilum]|uniref:Uncharacterized protein n=1 Tax=[Clostridium] aminophilum TaxID=1526 RepID=A0A1I0HAY4_9FIRM|nr:hypothetical protein SAMN04487771_10475 [[Clostridium] aminophilum]